MRILLAVLTVLVALSGDALAQGKLEQTEIDAWLVRDPQMSAQFAVADALGYFKDEGLKVNPRWYVAGTDLPSMWGAGNIHLGTATADDDRAHRGRRADHLQHRAPERHRRHPADRARQEGPGDRPLAQGLREAQDRHAEGRLGHDGHPGHGHATPASTSARSSS